MTDTAHVTTAPVFKVEGQVNHELARDLQRLEIEHTTEGLKTLQARFLGYGRPSDDGGDRELHLDGTLDFGKRVEVYLGPAGGDRRVFQGKVSAIELVVDEGGPSEVVIFAEDRLMDLRMTRRCKTWRNAGVTDIAQGIASEHGLSCDANVDGPTWDVVQQWNQSDLAFLRDRARLVRAELWVEDDTLYVKQRSGRSASSVTLTLGDELLSLRARADLAHQRTAVKVTGYDASSKAAISEEATNDVISAERSSGRTGPTVLERAFGARVSQRAREVCLTTDEAHRLAEAEMLRRGRSFVVAHGVTNGTVDMVVGSTLTLQSTAQPFDGDGYYVTRVVHTYDLEAGHRTRFEAERATVNEAS